MSLSYRFRRKCQLVKMTDMSHDTSWKQVGKWYDQIVSDEGHYYHQEVIFPKLQTWLKLHKDDAILDMGCGQGVLARQLKKGIVYYGLDLAPSLIEQAQKRSKEHQFFVRDVTKPLDLDRTNFSYALFILSLQNMKDPGQAITQATAHLKKGGKLILVLNHPCFRIPRQSHWEIDPEKKLQSRKVDRYMSPMEIPITMHPGEKKEEVRTYSYHFPLSDLCHFLTEAGLAITRLDEWCSNKESTGKWAKMENRARKEFPLFLALEATKS
ncbi:MAG: methyltransferase domain-containing protein [Simkania sp.]|nr:methyltransferase domain-containing protein [Simkania sp.]